MLGSSDSGRRVYEEQLANFSHSQEQRVIAKLFYAHAEMRAILYYDAYLGAGDDLLKFLSFEVSFEDRSCIKMIE